MLLPTETLTDILRLFRRSELDNLIRRLCRYTNAIVERHLAAGAGGPLHLVRRLCVDVVFAEPITSVRDEDEDIFVTTYFHYPWNTVDLRDLTKAVECTAIKEACLYLSTVCQDCLPSDELEGAECLNESAKAVEYRGRVDDPRAVEFLRGSVGVLFQRAEAVNVDLSSLPADVSVGLFNRVMSAMFGNLNDFGIPAPKMSKVSKSSCIAAHSARRLTIYSLSATDSLKLANLDALLSARAAVVLNAPRALRVAHFVRNYVDEVLPRFDCRKLILNIGSTAAEQAMNILIKKFSSTAAPLGNFVVDCYGWKKDPPLTLNNERTKEMLMLGDRRACLECAPASRC